MPSDWSDTSVYMVAAMMYAKAPVGCLSPAEFNWENDPVKIPDTVGIHHVLQHDGESYQLQM